MSDISTPEVPQDQLWTAIATVEGTDHDDYPVTLEVSRHARVTSLLRATDVDSGNRQYAYDPWGKGDADPLHGGAFLCHNEDYPLDAMLDLCADLDARLPGIEQGAALAHIERFRASFAPLDA